MEYPTLVLVLERELVPQEIVTEMLEVSVHMRIFLHHSPGPRLTLLSS